MKIVVIKATAVSEQHTAVFRFWIHVFERIEWVNDSVAYS